MKTSRKKVLYGHPDQKQRARYQRLLTNAGYCVEVVANGIECVQAFRESTPDVLILHPKLKWGCPLCVLAVLRDEGRLEGVEVLWTHDALASNFIEVHEAAPISPCVSSFDVLA